MGDKESGAKYERLKAVRGGHRGVTTRLIKEADELLATATPTEESKSRLTVIHKQLQLKHEVLSALDTQIVSLCDIGNIEEELLDAESVTARILECKVKIERNLKSSKAEPTSSELPVQPMAATAGRTRLPKIVLPKFRGDVTQWTTFWDSYKNAVHDNKDISTIDKFNYLKSLLEGSAARCIQGLPITEHNYDNAVELLQERLASHNS